jgi:hypothetical protein
MKTSHIPDDINEPLGNFAFHPLAFIAIARENESDFSNYAEIHDAIYKNRRRGNVLVFHAIPPKHTLLGRIYEYYKLKACVFKPSKEINLTCTYRSNYEDGVRFKNHEYLNLFNCQREYRKLNQNIFLTYLFYLKKSFSIFARSRRRMLGRDHCYATSVIIVETNLKVKHISLYFAINFV